MNSTTSRIPKDEKKAEGIKRMKDMGFNRSAIRQYQNLNRRTVFTDYRDDESKYAYDKELSAKVEDFEQESHALVYAIIRSHSNFGLIDNLLFVSDHKEDWELDRSNIKDCIAFVYAFNHNHPEFSEMGSIAIRVDQDGHPTRFFK